MSSKSKTLPKQEILDGFNKLRQEQRALALKITELEGDTIEHAAVLQALNKVDKDRKCYRLIGGVLVEHKVCDVIPALDKNKSQIEKLGEVLNKQLEEKGKELNDFKEKHNIKVQGPGGSEETPKPQEAPKSLGVLVEGDS